MPALMWPSHVLQLKNNYLQTLAIPNMELLRIKELTEQTQNCKSPKIGHPVLHKSQWFGIFTQEFISFFGGMREKNWEKMKILKSRSLEYWIKGLLL